MTKREAIEVAFKDYFIGIYTSSNPTTEAIEGCLQSIEHRVFDEMNVELFQEFIVEEVYTALTHHEISRARWVWGWILSGNWEIVGEMVCYAILNFLNGGSMPCPLNHTYLALIPKANNPTYFNEFRPIFLCNVLYKIIAKVLANRLKRVLPNIISSCQSSFILGHLITYNVLVAYEVLHKMKTQQRDKLVVWL